VGANEINVGDMIPRYILRIITKGDKGLILDVNGIETFLPINEIKHGWVDNISKEYKVGSQIFVKIKEIDKNNEESIKLKVSGKDAQLNPWGNNGFVKRLKLKDDVIGEVTGVREHMVFVRLADGVVSVARPFSNNIIDRSPFHQNHYNLRTGDIVKVRIVHINYEEKKIYSKIKKIEKKSLFYKW